MQTSARRSEASSPDQQPNTQGAKNQRRDSIDTAFRPQVGRGDDPRTHLPSQRGFDGEARDSAWAGRTEAALYQALAEVEGLAAGDINAECRQTLCRVTLLFPPTSDPDALRSMVYGKLEALRASLCAVEGLDCYRLSTTSFARSTPSVVICILEPPYVPSDPRTVNGRASAFWVGLSLTTAET
jgi:hypothetical protein